MKYGLDFGTTNSAIAIKENEEGKILEVDGAALDPRVIRTILYFNHRKLTYKETVAKVRIQNQTLFESDFYYEGNFFPLIGQAAVRKYLDENKHRHEGIVRTVFTGSLSAIGNYYEEIDYGVGRLLQGIKTALKSSSYYGTRIFGEFFSLEELVATYIGEVKRTADMLIVSEIDEVVCGRPVYFSDDPQKDKAAQDRLEGALKLAGFKKITFQLEPIAAAHQFISQSGEKAQTVFVFDFGGGTLDTAIVRIGKTKNQDKRDSEVLAADGVYIGGDLLNADIVRAKLWDYFGATATWGEAQLHMPPHIYEGLGNWYAMPNLNNPEFMQLFERLRYKNSNFKAVDRYIYLIKANVGFQLYEAIEKAKKELSQKETSQIIFKDGPIDIDVQITRDEFEEIISDRVEEIRQVVFRTLEKAKHSPEQIDVVVRTGGSSLIPVFEQQLVRIFGSKKIQQFETFTSIAAGLALE